MNILIIKKNFHPNTIGIVKALMNNNHSVSVIVHKKRGIEDHYNILEPQLIGYNRFSRFLLPLMSDKALDNFGIPKLITLAKAIKALKPKIIIIYQMKLSSIFSILIGKLMGSKLILLTETPTYKDSKINRFFSIIKLLPQNQIRVAGTGEVGSIHYFNFKPFKTLTMPYPIYPTDKNEKKKTMNKKIISIRSFDNPREK